MYNIYQIYLTYITDPMALPPTSCTVWYAKPDIANLQAKLVDPLKKVTLSGAIEPPIEAAIYHFRTSLIDAKEHALQLNMVPGGNGRTGVMIFQLKDDANWDDGVIRFEVIANQGKTIGQALTFIFERNRDKYMFTPEGVGCVFWNYTVLQDLADGGFVPSTAPGDYLVWEKSVLSARQGVHIRGEFY
jgi:hypothetical protein